MPDRPYTDADLRAAAALMHYALTTEPNPSDADSALSGHPAWAHVEVGSEEENTLRESVVELVSGAADTSAWAVHLGADGLEPSDEHEITLDAGDKALVRIHFAFAPDMPEEMRTNLVEGFEQALDDADASLDKPDPQDDGDEAAPQTPILFADAEEAPPGTDAADEVQQAEHTPEPT